MARHHDRALQERRDREYAATRNATELEALQKRWAAEDSAAEAAESWRTQEVLELRRRVAALERALGTGGRKLIDAIVPALGDALRRFRAEEREYHQAELDRRGYVTYAGTWDSERDYARGSMISHAGAGWIAVTACGKGEKPGRAPGWRLAAKSEGKPHEPTVA